MRVLLSKPTYPDAKTFWKELKGVLTRPKAAVGVLTGFRISASFRERMILVVTGVNQCRYCRAAHSALARACGIGQDEIDALLSGVVQDAPAHEQPALRFALEWARNGGFGRQEEWQNLEERYSRKGVAEIELILKGIRLGNLTGNSFDALVERVSK